MGDLIWKSVVGYEGVYEISEYGDLKRVGPIPGASVGRILKKTYDKDGYVRYGLMREAVLKHFRAARLVCMAFNGSPPAGKPWVLHNDGSKDNDHYTNLRWGSPSENIHDSVAHGTHWEAKKTECLRGHPLDSENTYIDGKGKRSCIKCRQEAIRKHYLRSQAKGLEPEDKRHGTVNGYCTYGCRCDPCKKARSDYKKRWMESKK